MLKKALVFLFVLGCFSLSAEFKDNRALAISAGNFSCQCQSLNPETLKCNQFRIMENGCISGTNEANVGQCVTDFQCANGSVGDVCEVACVPRSESRQADWGDLCGSSVSGRTVSCASGTSCLLSTDSNRYKCLKTNLGNNAQCNDSKECSGFDISNPAGSTICSTTPASPAQKICYSYVDQLNDNITRWEWDTGAGSCVENLNGSFTDPAQCNAFGPPTNVLPQTCCPSGFTQDLTSCPFFSQALHPNVCCRSVGPFRYDYKNKVACSEVLTNYSLCSQIPNTLSGSGGQSPFDKCTSCEAKNGIWTAVGCIEWQATTIIQEVIRIGLGIGGGVALLMILAAGFLFSTSQGDPKRTSDARELITSAVIGLLFIIFSITILQFTGVKILRIPGFGGTTSVTPGVSDGL